MLQTIILLLFEFNLLTVLNHTSRLPIVQGGTFTFLAPTFAVLAIPKFRCPDDFDTNGWGNITIDQKTEEWQIRIREIQGAICIASVFQVALGYFGITLLFYPNERRTELLLLLLL